MLFLYFYDCDHIEQLEKIYQQLSMFRMIRVDMTTGEQPYCGSMRMYENPEGLFHMTEHSYHICQWTGVECDRQGIIRSICWTNDKQRSQPPYVSLKHFDPRWIPLKVEKIYIANQHRATVDGTFSTRYLPRAAISVKILHSQLRGGLDMRNLPKFLQTLVVSGNFLSGTVDLRDLSQHFVLLGACDMWFQKIVVDNERLPISVENISFESRRRITVWEISGEALDKRISVKRT